MAKQKVVVARNGAELAEALHGYNPEKSVSFFLLPTRQLVASTKLFCSILRFYWRYGRTFDAL